MRVLFVAGVDLSLPGGIETHVRELALALGSRGHEVEILATPAELPPFRMVDRIEPSRYEVIHHQASAWPRGVAVPDRYVKTLHFCTAAKMSRYLELRRIRTLANPGNWRGVMEERASVRRPGRLIAVADRVVREFQRFYGLDPVRATVIPNGVTFATPTETRAAIRLRHGVPDTAPVLLTIGRADFVKGFDLLERCWRDVTARRPDAVWVNVGGTTPERAGGRVVTGSVPHADVVNWIHAADVGAVPSYYESFGIAMVEMIAGGLFVLAHDVGVAAEVIREGVNGRIVAPRVEAWRHALIETLGPHPRGAGLDAAFGWGRIAERTEAVYREVVARAPARHAS